MRTKFAQWWERRYFQITMALIAVLVVLEGMGL